MAAEFDFQGDYAITIGDDFLHEFVWEDENCAPLALSGTFHSQIKKGGVLIATFVCTLTGVGSNIVRLTLASGVTSALSPVKDASWDLESHDPDIRTVVKGKVDIVKGVTEVP